jgi:hypothetical protein
MGLGSGFRKPGTGMRIKPIPEPGSSVIFTGSRIRIRNTDHEQLKVKPTYVIVFPILSVQALDEFHSL